METGEAVANLLARFLSRWTKHKVETHIMIRSIEEIHRDWTGRLMALPGVVGTAIGASAGSACIMVYVKSKTDDVVRGIPSSVEGYPLEIAETGEFRAR